MTQEAFLSLIIPLQERLFRFAFHLLRNEEEAKDLVQDALVRIWEKRSLLTEVNNAEAWCIRIVKNMVVDRMRYNRYRTMDDIDEEKERSTEHNEAVEKSELNDTVHSIRKIMDQLPLK